MEIRDYHQGDEKAILKLFETTFGKPMSEAYWKWRFLENPENKVMIKLMWDNDVLAGHYAVSPIRVNMHGQQLLTALSMTTMTHPDYSGQGIFTGLAEALYQEEANRSGLKAVWGFPNNNSHYGFIKNLKWTNLEQIPVFSLVVNHSRESSSSSIAVNNNFNDTHVKAFQETINKNLIHVDRSLKYLNWRYMTNPSNKYDLFELIDNSIAYFAVAKAFPSFSEKNKFEVDILEIAFPNDYTIVVQLINSIREYYSKYDVIKINCWLPLEDSRHLLLEKAGFINQSPVTYSGVRILDNEYNGLALARNWFYSMGDSDIY